ncbi:hypothetical protein DYBT9623_04903 [Dyadobacter sp. CECT 9623]|jgi:hypothetical protein|uniref:Lipoprotein n=1 Tax=Dyadobacter linearis TaxID=2823330 RepID=A0ABN7RI63_9BACT|nr:MULTISPECIES: hypothetical protein [unclassified Dyadobacter]MCE7063010.1 hypothetical protein [Dyadobacter sp. CY343]CAG5073750.1 hypothetical protein DYBT9623_04903 [Dyadobacter sp. CECT 9623]
MKVYKIVAFVACVALLSSCEYQKYNHIEQSDVNKGDKEIYGVSPDSLPRQMSYKYDAQPELDTRVNDIRAKLYGGMTNSVVKQ